MPSLFDSRFVINTGKGGVGKTMVSAAMAVAFAAKGKRVLFMQLNATDGVGALFGTAPIGPEIVEIVPLVHAVNTTPADSLREYALMVLRVKALYRAVFENRLVGRLLKVMPGLPELTMLGKAYFHEGERDDRGRHRYDVVIVDAPATGHGMFLLQIPQVISGALRSGRMADESQRMLALLEDHSRTVVNLVTLPEEMPVTETIELRNQLASRFKIRIGAVVVNQVLPRALSTEDTMLARQLLNAHHDELDEVGALLAAAIFRSDRCELQQRYIQTLKRELGIPLVEIPFYFDARFDRTVVERMGAHIAQVFRSEAQR